MTLNQHWLEASFLTLSSIRSNLLHFKRWLLFRIEATMPNVLIVISSRISKSKYVIIYRLQ